MSAALLQAMSVYFVRVHGPIQSQFISRIRCRASGDLRGFMAQVVR